jgi:excisionase family DNA binding protein
MIDSNKPLWQLTVGEFLELQNSAAPTEVKEIVEDSYLNSKEAQAYLKVSVTTLYRWRKDKYIKFEKKGGIVRFRKSECDKVLNQVF